MDQRSVANRREWEGGGGGVQQPMYPPIGGDDSAQASTPITVTVVSSEAGTAAADGADDKLRMRVNGETPAQLAHARMRKARTTDTTVDEVWPIDDSLKSADSYVKFCTLLYLIPKFIILLIPMLLLAVPFALISRLYAMFLPYGTDQVERKAPGFLIYFFSASLSLMPLSFFWAWSRISDCVFYYIFGLPYLIFSKDGWARRQRSLDAIRPHMNGSFPLVPFSHPPFCSSATFPTSLWTGPTSATSWCLVATRKKSHNFGQDPHTPFAIVQDR
jgi:hypothetical protein